MIIWVPMLKLNVNSGDYHRRHLSILPDQGLRISTHPFRKSTGSFAVLQRGCQGQIGKDDYLMEEENDKIYQPSIHIFENLTVEKFLLTVRKEFGLCTVDTVIQSLSPFFFPRLSSSHHSRFFAVFFSVRRKWLQSTASNSASTWSPSTSARSLLYVTLNLHGFYWHSIH